MKNTLGINTFGISKQLKKNFDETVSCLKRTGISAIEPCVVFSDAFNLAYEKLCRFGFNVVGLDGGNWFGPRADLLTARARNLGMDVFGVHCALCNHSYDTLQRIIPYAVDFAAKNKIKYYVVSLMTGNRERTKRFLPALKAFTDALSDCGVQTLYHNHDSEIRENNLEFILNGIPELGLELDAGWAAFAGCNPIDIANKFEGRLKIIHLKDFSTVKNRNSFVPVGTGILPLKELVLFAEEKNIALVIDQDGGKEILGDIACGVKNIEKIKAARGNE